MQARDCCPERKTIVPDDIIGDVVACADEAISRASNLCDPFGRRHRADARSAGARSADARSADARSADARSTDA
jgi:hypothetical protein